MAHRIKRLSDLDLVVSDITRYVRKNGPQTVRNLARVLDEFQTTIKRAVAMDVGVRVQLVDGKVVSTSDKGRYVNNDSVLPSIYHESAHTKANRWLSSRD